MDDWLLQYDQWHGRWNWIDVGSFSKGGEGRKQQSPLWIYIGAYSTPSKTNLSTTN